jgi:hypothetical protein
LASQVCVCKVLYFLWQNYCPLARDAVQSTMQLQMFERKALSSFSVHNMKATRTPKRRCLSTRYKAQSSHSRRERHKYHRVHANTVRPYESTVSCSSWKNCPYCIKKVINWCYVGSN